ncbi:MAG: NADPH-dependent F420 reductase [Thermoproteota archaeon]|jgi:8-hydroxy-5-deazaflavin:NADPH oxidoreductase|nr:NADPH-dependent F420 reductase [Thermoproteota archaeon]
MKVGLIGGTGGMGEGFALRWSSRHDVIIGSREVQKAKDAAETYAKVAKESYGNSMTGSITGDENLAVTKSSDILLLSIHYEHIADMCSQLSKQLRDDCIVITPIVPMEKTGAGFVYIPLEQSKKPAAEIVADNLPPRSRIVSAFHTISEARLKNITESLDSDTFVCGDDRNIVSTVNSLISEIAGLRPIYLGPLSISYQAEILTPMLLNSAHRNKIKNPGIRIV